MMPKKKIKIHDYVIGEGVKTGKIEKLKGSWKKLGIFTFLKNLSCNNQIVQLGLLMKSDTETKKQQA